MADRNTVDYQSGYSDGYNSKTRRIFSSSSAAADNYNAGFDSGLSDISAAHGFFGDTGKPTAWYKDKKKLLIGGGVLAAAIGGYFLFRGKR